MKLSERLLSINNLGDALRLVPEVKALEARLAALEAPEPALCECRDRAMGGFPAMAYWPLDVHGEPTGHHPACPHYVPPR